MRPSLPKPALTILRNVLGVYLGVVLCCICGIAQDTHPPATPGKSSATSQTSAMREADRAFREGYAASQRNDFEAARVSFQKAVDLAPQIEASHAALGATLLALGDSSAAVRELETARRLDQSDTSNLLNLCVAYSNLHRYLETIATFRLLEADAAQANSLALPGDVAIAVATALSSTAEIEKAQIVLQSSLDQSIRDGQESSRLQDALGSVLAQEKRLVEAEPHFARAIALDESLAVAHFHLGSVEMTTGHAAEATVALRRAHRLDPANTAYALELARALQAAGEEAAAIDLLRETLAKMQPASGPAAIEMKYRLALALQSTGDAKDALPLFAEVIAARPGDAEAMTNTALAHVQLGDAKGGVLLYLKALALTPSNPALREDLGVAYLQQADLDHALEQFRAGLAIDKDSPQLHYDLGLALKLKDNLAEAVPEFERAAELDPSLPDPPFTLGIIFMQQGEFGKSAASFERAVALRPDNADAWATLGSVYQQMQQPDKAIPAVRKAIALSPNQPSPHITLATILSAQGHKDEAVAERKTGAALSRAAVNRQKANFGLDSGNLLMKRGQTDDAIVQFQSAVDADPAFAAPHLALAAALDHAGRKAEAAEERRKVAAPGTASSPPPQ